MKTKLFCPHCGRCLGESISSDNSGITRVLANPPKHIKEKHFIHDMKCVKCKSEIFILMEFTN